MTPGYKALIKEADKRQKAKVSALDRELNAVEERALFAEVFFDWLDDDRLDDLISAIDCIYKSISVQEGRIEFVRELRYELQQRNDVARLHRLFQVTAKRLWRELWREQKHAAAGLVGNIANAAELKGKLLRILYEYFYAMHALGLKELAEEIRQEMMLIFSDKKHPLWFSAWVAANIGKRS